jgi:hypothetical protein
LAEVTAYADDAIVGSINNGPGVTAMGVQLVLDVALWAAVGPVLIGVGDRLGVLLDRAGEWV